MSETVDSMPLDAVPQRAAVATSSPTVVAPAAAIVQEPAQPRANVTQGLDRRAIAAIVLAVLAIVAFYWTTGETMVSTWMNSQTFAHGFVVPPIAAWLVWRRRAVLGEMPVRPAFVFLGAMAVCGVLWLAGQLGEVNALAQFAMVLMIIASVPVVLGTNIARELSFPLAFLLFAVPIGEFAMPQLMQWTADFTVLALRASGVPVYREGLLFVIPSGSWSVVEACSGVRYLIASFMVGTLYAYLTYHTMRRRVAFMAVAVAVPIVANWLRAYMIVMLGHLSNNRLAVGVDHVIYGWVFFGVVMALMFFIGSSWHEPEVAAASAGALPAPSPSPVSAAPGSIWMAAACVVFVAALFPLAQLGLRSVNSAAVPQIVDPRIAPEWQPTGASTIDWRPAYQHPSAEYRRVYRRDDALLGVYLAFYRNQNRTTKLVNSENQLVKSLDPKWLQLATNRRPVELGGTTAVAHEALLRDASGNVMKVWQWYWIDGHVTSNAYVAKAYTALAQLLGHGDDSAAIIIYALDGRVPASRSLYDFVHENGAAVLQSLRETSARR